MICWLDLTDFRETGETEHYVNLDLLPKPAALSICRYATDAKGVSLFYHDAEWGIQSDVECETIDDAKAQAGFEFEGADTATWSVETL